MSSQTSQPKVYEDKPGWANLWPPRNPLSKSAYTGVITLKENNQKYWVNVYPKSDKNGTKYLSIHIEPKTQKETPQTSS